MPVGVYDMLLGEGCSERDLRFMLDVCYRMGGGEGIFTGSIRYP